MVRELLSEPLVFEGYEDDQIVLRLRPMAMDDYFDLAARFDGLATKESDPLGLAQAAGDYGVVASWTFPEAPDGAGMRRRDASLVVAIVAEWLHEVQDVALPLVVRPSGGMPSTPEASPEPLLGQS